MLLHQTYCYRRDPSLNAGVERRLNCNGPWNNPLSSAFAEHGNHTNPSFFPERRLSSFRKRLFLRLYSELVKFLDFCLRWNLSDWRLESTHLAFPRIGNDFKFGSAKGAYQFIIHHHTQPDKAAAAVECSSIDWARMHHVRPLALEGSRPSLVGISVTQLAVFVLKQLIMFN